MMKGGKRIVSVCTAAAMAAACLGASAGTVAAEDESSSDFDPEQVIWFDTVPENDSTVSSYLATKGGVYYGESKAAPLYIIDPNNKNDTADYGNVTDSGEGETVSSRILSRIMSYLAMPIGNGRLGGMIYGAIDKEIVQINEDTFYTLQPSEDDYVLDLDYDNMSSDSYIYKNGSGDTYKTLYEAADETLKAKLPEPEPATLTEAWENIKNWSVNIDESDYEVRTAMETYINCYFLGEPYKQAAYQSFVELYLDFGQTSDGVSNYTRSLDISDAVATVEYDYGDTHYTRENFVSYDKQAVVTHLTADGADKLNVCAELHAWQHSTTFEKIADNQIAVYGKGQNSELCYEARLIIDTDGQVEVTSVTDSPVKSATVSNETTYTYPEEGSLNAISVTNATYATCYVVGATSYISDETGVHVTAGDSATPRSRCEAYAAELAAPDYDAIKAAHIADYQSYYTRSSINLEGGTTENVPTGERLDNFATTADASLVNLYYNFAKYLMISGSREGSQPMNLQGIWNASNMPAWDSKYTININTEMNYWMAQTANLGEFEKPLLEAILELEEPGETVAREYYGIEDAFVVHHNFDVWRGASIVDKASTGLWPVGGAWLLNHAWEYYQFNLDADYLAEFYPLMKKGIHFFDELMVEDPVTGYLISPASVSPEQGGVQPGPTMDHQLIRNLYDITIKTNEVLKEAGLIGDEDDALAAEWAETMSKICPNQVGSDGLIKEWVRDVTYDAAGTSKVSTSHKHTSHLWDIYPGTAVNPFSEKTEEEQAIYNAFSASLTKRNSSLTRLTGWAIAWRLNLCARMCDAESAYSVISTLLTTGTYSNGFDRHPPFQIDGNFGGAAGIQECLIQSYADTVNIIPALPDQWSAGEFSNLKARGNFEISAKWNEGLVYELTAKSLNGGEIKLRTEANTGVLKVYDDLGNSIPFTKEDEGTVVVFDTEAGRTYSLKGLTGVSEEEKAKAATWTRGVNDVIELITVTRDTGKTSAELPKLVVTNSPGNVSYLFDTRTQYGGYTETSIENGFAVKMSNIENLQSMTVTLASKHTGDATIYVRADSQDGPLVASGKVKYTGGTSSAYYEDVELDISDENPGGQHVLYVLVSCDEGSEVKEEYICNIRYLSGVCDDGILTLTQESGEVAVDVDSSAIEFLDSAKLIVGLFDTDGKLEDADIFDVSMSDTSARYTLPTGSEGKTVKAMLWDSMSAMTPQSQAEELSVQ